MFYVYECFIKDSGEIIYVGKGSKKRYKAKKKNKLLNEFLNRFDCDVRIIEYFDNELDAFEKEAKRVHELKNIGQCVCNNHRGGFGGCSYIWNDERRKKASENNGMKHAEQRKRMSICNPMKDPVIAAKSGAEHKRAIVLDNKYYASQIDAAAIINVSTNTILTWLKRGYNSKGKACYYADTPRNAKDVKLKTTNSKQVIVDGKIFDSVRSAAKFIECAPETIIRNIKNNRLCKGFKCIYVNQQPS